MIRANSFQTAAVSQSFLACEKRPELLSFFVTSGVGGTRLTLSCRSISMTYLEKAKTIRIKFMQKQEEQYLGGAKKKKKIVADYGNMGCQVSKKGYKIKNIFCQNTNFFVIDIRHCAELTILILLFTQTLNKNKLFLI